MTLHCTTRTCQNPPTPLNMNVQPRQTVNENGVLQNG